MPQKNRHFIFALLAFAAAGGALAAAVFALGGAFSPLFFGAASALAAAGATAAAHFAALALWRARGGRAADALAFWAWRFSFCILLLALAARALAAGGALAGGGFVFGACAGLLLFFTPVGKRARAKK